MLLIRRSLLVCSFFLMVYGGGVQGVVEEESMEKKEESKKRHLDSLLNNLREKVQRKYGEFAVDKVDKKGFSCGRGQCSPYRKIREIQKLELVK